MEDDVESRAGVDPLMAAKWMPEGASPPVIVEKAGPITVAHAPAPAASKAAAKAAAEKFADLTSTIIGTPIQLNAIADHVIAGAALADGLPPVVVSMQENASKLIALDQQISDAEKLLAALEASRKMVEEALTEQFVEAGVQNVKMMGRTVFLARSVYCNIPAETMGELVEVLDKEGVGESLAPRTVTAARIKGLLKEDEEKWTEKLKGLISTGERFSIRNRSAS